ncbi:MAG: 3-oxoacyl-ACP synthase, partial [Myxococcaceae bacterium]|nr:3-oxoacyl-ACP synthase [Myxococcaceae bacterium]
RVGPAYWQKMYPQLISDAVDRSLARIWAAPTAESSAPLFDTAAAPYMSDPFRGAKDRYFLGDDEDSRSLELAVAREVLGAAGLEAADIGLMIVTSFLPQNVAVGNAAWLAAQLGLRGEAFNLESACAGSVVAFQLACRLVSSGAYARVLVVTSCTYSRIVDEADTLSWSVGDGATAFVVGQTEAGSGWLGGKTMHTGQTCGVMYTGPVDSPQGPVLRMRPGLRPAAVLRETAEPIFRACVQGALESAGLGLDAIDFFVTTTPTAWYSKFCGQVLGYPASKTVNLHPHISNVGPVMVPASLHHAASLELIKPGDRVLLYAIGSEAQASAAVVKWGEVALGPSRAITSPGTGPSDPRSC